MAAAGFMDGWHIRSPQCDRAVTLSLAIKNRLWSVHPGVGVQAVLLPQLTASGRVVLDHRQAVGQESSGCWVLRPLTLHLSCKTERKTQHDFREKSILKYTAHSHLGSRRFTSSSTKTRLGRICTRVKVRNKCLCKDAFRLFVKQISALLNLKKSDTWTVYSGVTTCQFLCHLHLCSLCTSNLFYDVCELTQIKVF